MSTSSALHLLGELTRLGIELAAEADKIRFRPRAKMTRSLAGRVGDHRDEILRLLWLPRSWLEACVEAQAACRPAGIPTEDWEWWRRDFEALLCSPFAPSLVEAGWTLDCLVSVHASVPLARPDCMGLVPLLEGAAIVDVDMAYVRVRLPSGAVQTVTRPSADGAPTRRFWEHPPANN